jgi:uncharacterized protein involved in type VI secretion and phage assembly
MMGRMTNVMRAHAMMAGQSRQGTRLAVVSAYDPATYRVKVQFMPANEDGDVPESGWIPLGAIGVGNNWGVLVGPSIGDQIEVEFQDGAQDAGIAAMRLFSTQAVPPKVPSGEIWFVHASGAFFKLLNAGGGIFSDEHGASVALSGTGLITSTGTWTHQGALTVQQNLTVQGQTAVAAITSNGHDISSTHKHTGVQTGSGISGTPQ